MRLSYLRWTKIKGIGGKLLQPEDFLVKELIDKKFLRTFSRSGNGVAKQSGYFLYLLKKKDMTTKQALRFLSNKFHIDEKTIGYAGLKDKFAVTEQYITMKKEVPNISTDNLSLKKLKPTSKFISRGDLLGNEFVVTLHGAKFSEEAAKEIFSKKMPNYFGPQRFGNNENNQVIGKHIIKREFVKALTLINKNTGKNYTDIRSIDKDELKFYIHAYQSWIFNEALNQSIKTKKKVDELKLIGSDTKLGTNTADKLVLAIAKKEGLKPADFSLRDLSLSCQGSARKAFISVTDVNYTVGDAVTLRFTLPKGSYATVLLNELCG